MPLYPGTRAYSCAPISTIQSVKQMNFKQRDLLLGLYRRADALSDASHRLMRDCKALAHTFDQSLADQDLSEADIETLLQLNQRLIDLESFLVNRAAKQSELLEPRVADAHDPIYDYEIEAQLDFILREDDPDYDPDDDCILTSRHFDIKRLDGERGIGDTEDHREPIRLFLRALGQNRHCYLFHDLYDHGYGVEQTALSLRDCARVGEIWVDIQSTEQVALSVEKGGWRYKK